MISFRRWLRRNRRWSVPVLRTVFVASLLLLVGAGLLGYQAWRAKGDLATARTALTAARQAVTDADADAARRDLARARDAATRAQGRTTGAWSPLWSVYGALPGVGAAVRETRGLVHEAYVVTADVLPPLVDSVSQQSQQWQGHVDIAALQRVSPRLQRADQALTASRTRLDGLPVSRIARLDAARLSFAQALDGLATDLREASVGAQVLPDLLGASRPGHLLVVAQNLAEERATGGLIGAYALLRTDAGGFAVQQSGSGTDLQDASAPVVDLGSDFQARYGTAQAAQTWRSANLTPDTPTAGAILAGLAARQLGVQVDGVLFLDPVGLQDILRGTGPVDDGALGQLTADNAAQVLLHDVYAAYPRAQDNAVRDGLFQRALTGVVDRLSQPGPALRPLLSGLHHAARTGHLQVYATAVPAEDLVREATFGGALPSTGPYLSVVTQDVGGSKLDYYLHRSVSYDAVPSQVAVDVGAGPQDEEAATLTVQLRSTAPPSGLPFYVAYRADLPHGAATPVGQLRSWVSVYLGPGASYSSATVDGRPVALSSNAERGLAVFSTYVDVDPGTTVTLVLHVRQPAAAGSVLLWRQQPRLEDDTLTVNRAYASLYDVG